MIYKGYTYFIEMEDSDDSIINLGKPTEDKTEDGTEEATEDVTEEAPTEEETQGGGRKDKKDKTEEETTTEDSTEDNSITGVGLTTEEAVEDSTEELITTTEAAEDSEDSKQGLNLTTIFGITSAVLLLIVIYLASALSKLKNKQNNYDDTDDDYSDSSNDFSGEVKETGQSEVSNLSKTAEDRVGKLHNIGRRKGQQDSLGLTEYNGGTLAIVADGMGGLADGDRVSQKIVMTLLQDSTKLSGGSPDNKLYEMIAHANREVNQMLGPEGLYKSGSTLLAVMAEKDGFHWAAVGDSHIYLYRAGKLLLMNREHVYEAELIQKAINGENSFAEVKTNPKKSGLTSFIGMGNLKYIDGSIDKVASGEGDWILLMSDGVFNTVPEPDMCKLLNDAPSAKVAAERLEQEVLRRQNPKQDNFTAIILEL